LKFAKSILAFDFSAMVAERDVLVPLGLGVWHLAVFQTTTNMDLLTTWASDLCDLQAMEPAPYIDRTEAGDLFNFTPQQLKFKELRELGLQVYKQVLKEFYDWNPIECQQTLDSFAGGRVPGDRQKYHKMIDQLFHPVLHNSDMPVENSTQPSLIITQYDTDGRGISYPILIEEISVDPTFHSHPPYESCPPINQSILDDHPLHKPAAFIPYADEEHFPVVDYLQHFRHFSWEEHFDPDCKPWLA